MNPGSVMIYRVIAGDTLRKIARKFRRSVGELLLANPQLTPKQGRDPDVIYPDEEITIAAPRFNLTIAETTAVQGCMMTQTQMAEQTSKPKRKNNDKVYAIVVADRVVGDYLFGIYHYSIQLWQYDNEIGEDDEMSLGDLNFKGGSALKQASIELLRNNNNWKVWKYQNTDWKVRGVSISVIHFSDRSDKLAIIKEGDKREVLAVWQSIERLASSYGFAEQGGDEFTGDFKCWPDSKYQLPKETPFNNSNTFIRYLISQAGLAMKELNGFHPGEQQPEAVANIYSERPWQDSQKPPAKPNYTPNITI